MKTEIKLERSKLSWSGSLKTVIAYFVMVLFFFLLKPGYLGASNPNHPDSDCASGNYRQRYDSGNVHRWCGYVRWRRCWRFYPGCSL